MHTRILTKTEKNAARKLLVLHNKMKQLQKNRNRKGPSQKKNERKFNETLPDLFDITSADAWRNPSQSIDCFSLQREEDPRLELTEERRAYREDRRVYLQQEESIMTQLRSATVHSVEHESCTSSSSPEYIPDEEAHPLLKVLQTTGQRQIPMVSPNLAAALDRTAKILTS